MDPTIFRYIGVSIENTAAEFLSPVIGAVIGAVSAVVAVGVSLYILIIGLLIATGYIAQPMNEFAGKAVKIVIVTSIALSASAYGSYVVGVINGMEGMFAKAFGADDGAGASIYATLDRSFGIGLELVSRCFEAARNAGRFAFGAIIGWTLAGLIIALGIVALNLIGGCILILAKFAIAMMIAVGPLFVVLLIWPVTARYFEAWVGQIVNFTLTVAFIVLIMAFSVAMFTGFVTEVDLDGGSAPIVVALEVVVLAGFLAFLAYQTQSWAASLSGGMSMAVLTLRHAAAPARMAASAGRGARDIVDPRSTRRDLESGHMVTARRLNHLTAGNTVINPAYRQHVREQFGKNWSRARGGKATRG